MLHILQTGDLHIGKSFHEISLIEDQEYVLQQLISELQKEKYDLFLIAGDVYDRSIPSPEAVALFDKFLSQVHQVCPQLEVGIISGNHDSGRRLSFGASFFTSAHIHIQTQADNITTPILLYGSNKEPYALYQIPFLQSGSFFKEDGSPITSQSDLLSVASQKIQESHKKLEEEKGEKIPCLINAHLFVLGGLKSESERVFIGNSELVSPDLFSFATYGAFGHLHKMQKVSSKLYYAGSPLSYSFDEANTKKYALKITITDDTKEAVITPLPLTPLHPVIKLEGDFQDFLQNTPDETTANSYIQFTCTNKSIIENPLVQLKAKYPYILSLIQKSRKGSDENTLSQEKKRLLLKNKESDLNLENIFKAFITDVYSQTDLTQWETEINTIMHVAKELEKEEQE